MQLPHQLTDTISTSTGGITEDAVSLFGSIISEVWPWLLGFGALFALVFYIKGRVGGIGR